MTDDDRTGIAAWIIRKYQPHVTLLHIFDTDSAQHTYGPGSPEALAAIEAADSHVQQVLTAVASAGLAERTDVVIVSDHGFLPLSQQLQPNNAFKREGLVDVDEAGKIRRWDAYYYGAGGSGFVVLRNPDDAVLRQRVGTLLRTLGRRSGQRHSDGPQPGRLARARRRPARRLRHRHADWVLFRLGPRCVADQGDVERRPRICADPAGTPRVTGDAWARCAKGRQPWRSSHDPNRADDCLMARRRTVAWRRCPTRPARSVEPLARRQQRRARLPARYLRATPRGNISVLPCRR